LPRHCSICAHELVRQIDQALVEGTAISEISAVFRVSDDALSRHRANHLPAALARAQGAKQAAQADNLFGQVRDLQVRALGILDRAEASNELRTALGAIREARGNLELLAKLLAFEHKNKQVYSHEDLRAEMALVVDVITQNVEDRATLAKINDGLLAILEKNETG
jgi:hypothetical protein